MPPRLTRLVSLLLAVAVLYAVHVLLLEQSNGVNSGPRIRVVRPPVPALRAGRKGLSGGYDHDLPGVAKRVDPTRGLAQSRKTPKVRPAKVKKSEAQHPLWTPHQDFKYNLPIDEKGEVAYTPGVERHPIEELIERGRLRKQQLDEKIASVQKLSDAIADYETTWGMKPPKGFETWFKYAKDQGSVAVASLFPMSHKPFLQFLALPADKLRERIAKTLPQKPFFTLTFVPDGQGDEGTQCDADGSWAVKDWHTRGRGRVIVGGNKGWAWRCNNTLTLLLPILPHFPDEFFRQEPPITILFNTDDGPRGQVHRSLQERGESLGKAGKTWPEAQLQTAETNQKWTQGWQWTCPEDSPLRKSALETVLNDDNESNVSSAKKTFVADFYKNIDVCYNPAIRDMHSNALNDHRFANVDLVPYVSLCRTMRHSDLVGVPLDAVFQEVDLVPWSEKKSNKVLWRGSPTGIYHNRELPWRKSQRERLHFFANNKTDASREVLIERDGKVVVEEYPVQMMNKKWFNVGLTGHRRGWQCSEADGTCQDMEDEIEWAEGVRGAAGLDYKFVVDVDGNGWSSRFRRLLLSNNVVLKSTLFPEWFNDLLIPWYHYVPIRFDYSDVYDIMAYFEGAPDGSNTDHDDLAGEIALNGHNFIKEHWRIPDMRSYMFLMMLEYWRLMSEDRAAAVYTA